VAGVRIVPQFKSQAPTFQNSPIPKQRNVFSEFFLFVKFKYEKVLKIIYISSTAERSSLSFVEYKSGELEIK